MSELFLLSERRMARISPSFLLAQGVPRVDDRRVVSGIVYVIRNWLQWKDAPKAEGRIRRSTTGSCAGAGGACSTRSLRLWPVRVPNRCRS